MRAEELRIGNWVQFKHTETPVRITLGDFVRQYKEGHLDNYEPIPLTEEWLELMGFDKLSDNCWLNDDDGRFYVDKMSISEKFVYYFKEDSNDFIPIPSVHKIQNLYFALKGEELTIKQ